MKLEDKITDIIYQNVHPEINYSTQNINISGQEDAALAIKLLLIEMGVPSKVFEAEIEGEEIE